MAKKTTKPAAKSASKPAADVPVTGLGETIEQITQTCNTLSDALMALIPGKLPKEKRDAIEQAAYKYGVAERRRRKLARKLGKNGNGGEDE